MANLIFQATLDNKKEVLLKAQLLQEEVCFTLPRSEMEGIGDLTITSPSFNASAGDGGFYLFPGTPSTGGSALTYFTLREDCELLLKRPTVSFFAVGKPEAVYVVWVDRTVAYEVFGSCKNGDYRIGLHVDFNVQPLTSDICLHLLTLNACSDYNDVARAIREYRLRKGEIRPLADKIKEREPLYYAMRHPVVRIRMGWKPHPTPVPIQTLENEPPMRVSCDFARVRDLADEFKRQGVEGAEFCLVGWNQKGHDGRWPQIFPVEEALGGEKELKKTIAHVQSLGYRVTCHTNTIDHYEIADVFDVEKLAHNKEGNPIQKGVWSGGRAFHACPVTQLERAKADLPRVAALGFSGLHYIDVLSILNPPACFHPNHVCGIEQGVAYMREIMRLCRELFGGFSSEGCLDFAAGELDFALYNSFKSYKTAPAGLEDKLIPMWELVYHGILLYNSSAETVNYTVKTPDEAVSFALYGGKPTFYYYSKFVDEGRNWMGSVDMLCDTDEQLRESVARVKAAQEQYRPLLPLQTVYLRSYEERGDGLRIMTYENGVRVAGNYTDGDLELNGKTVAAHGYCVFD